MCVGVCDIMKDIGVSTSNSLVALCMRYTHTRLQQLKSTRFITGGWDSAEEEEHPQKNTQKNTKKKNTHTHTHKQTNTQDSENPPKEENSLEENMKLEKAKLELSASRLHEAREHEDGGAKIGSYVRVCVCGVNKEWLDELNISRPIVVGGLLPGEGGNSFMKIKVKKHRWAPKILKSNDPVLLSCGWRRYQGIPMYSIDDRNQARLRFLKYTPEHMHCSAIVYGPLCPPNTGVLAIKSWSKLQHFRISMTGVCVDANTNSKVVKKLKLVGEPEKVYKHTAFIKGMFNSNLEVAKCIGSKIQTVSGIRGQIKKAQGKDGLFRATFEDKILKSDLVLLKSWVGVSPVQFYNPVVDVSQWRRMKCIAELRVETETPAQYKKDGQYPKTKQERQPRKFNDIKIPLGIMKNLPFNLRPQSRDERPPPSSAIEAATALVSSPHETAVREFLQGLSTIAAERQHHRETTLKKKREIAAKTEAREKEKREGIKKEVLKRKYVTQGKKETALKRKRLG
eukprot:GHVR01129867.1.p1 GENE.GHVR01129867.1~~GHVR01129867.1.p1  ORF type:complete len:510 (+),score=142.37 GHVR01129867.1:333-1862(+)